MPVHPDELEEEVVNNVFFVQLMNRKEKNYGVCSPENRFSLPNPFSLYNFC